jgi:hypothetical protein
MRVSRHWVVVLVLFALMQAQSSTLVNGGRGLPHTKSAMTTYPKQLWAMAQISFWGKRADFEYHSLGVESGSTFWLVQSLARFNYGVSEHVSASLSPILYQDVNDGGADEFFGDTMLDVKVGNYQIEKTAITVGMNVGMRFPTGSHKNIIFEDYSAGRFEWGLTGILTYRYSLPDLKNDYRIHLNLGYWNYNDSGVSLVDDVLFQDIAYVKRNSQALNYALGLEFPTAAFDYGLEFYGLSWVNSPPAAAAGRENNLYMNVSLGYKPHPRFKFYTNADLRLSKDIEETQGPRATFSGLPNYPSWRVYLGLRYMIIPKSLYDMHKQVLLDNKRHKRQQLLIQLNEERQKTLIAKQEAERLRIEKEKKEKAKAASEVVLEKK